MDNSNKEACQGTDIKSEIPAGESNNTSNNEEELESASGEVSEASDEKESHFWNVVIAAIVIAIVYYGKTQTAVTVLAMIAIIATVHEFGHYLLAKIVGVRVDEFAIGMGSKKLWKKQIGETEYSIRPIPLGAFVKPAGMDPDEEFDPDDDPGERSFNNKSLPAKLAILFGGPVANVILTIILSTAIFFFVGDRTSTIKVDKIIKDKPAAVAGIRSGDIILTINGKEIKNYMDGITLIGEFPNRSILLEISRPYEVDGSDEPVYKTITIPVTPEPNDDGVGKIGIMAQMHYSQDEYIPVPFVKALMMGVNQTVVYGYKTYEAALGMFKRIFTKFDMPAQIGGPVKIASTIGDAMEGGFDIVTFVSFVSWLSLSIGVFNLIPIPALDGGRILLLLISYALSLIYRVIGREVPEEGIISSNIEELIHVAGFIFLILLFIAITGKDIKEWWSPPTQLERLNLKEEDLIDNKPSANEVKDSVSSNDPASMEDHLDDPGKDLSDAPADVDAYYGLVTAPVEKTTPGDVTRTEKDK